MVILGVWVARNEQAASPNMALFGFVTFPRFHLSREDVFSLP